MHAPGRLLILFLLFFLPLTALPAQSAPTPDTFLLSNAPQRLIALRGPFRFHSGDDPLYALPSFDDTTWSLLPGDARWPLSGPTRNLSGYAWYRFRILIPAHTGPLAIELPQVLTSYQLFVDGQLLGSPLPTPLDHQAIRAQRAVYDLPAGPSTPHTLTFALRIWQWPQWSAYYGGGPVEPLYFGAAHLVHRDLILLQEQFVWFGTDRILLATLQAVTALATFALFMIRTSVRGPQRRVQLPQGSGAVAERQRHVAVLGGQGSPPSTGGPTQPPTRTLHSEPAADERAYLWFSLSMLFSATRHIAFLAIYSHNSSLLLGDLALNLLDGLTLATALFFYAHLLSAPRRFLYPLAALQFVGPLLPVLPVHLPSALSSIISTFILLITSTWIVLLFVSALRRGVADAKLLLIPVFVQQSAATASAVLWTLYAAGLQHFLDHTDIELTQNPFFITLLDCTTAFYLLGILAILLLRFARTARAQDRLQADLHAARTLQELLIPTTLPPVPGFHVETAYHPAQEVGGDFFQILPLPDGSTLAVLGDVAGKGLPAAMTVSLLVGALRSLVETTHSPVQLLLGLNRLLLGRATGFTTALVLHLQPSGQLTLSNAGHLSPYLNGAELPTQPALPLGLDPHPFFPEQTLLLHPADRLTLLTDGIPEATSNRELFGFPRTAQLSTLPASLLAQQAIAFGQTDDITILSLVANS